MAGKSEAEQVGVPVQPRPLQKAAVEDFDEEMVTMVFPTVVNLATDDGRLVTFAKGPCQVPKSLKDHWYLKAHGVKAYESKQPARRKGGDDASQSGNEQGSDK